MSIITKLFVSKKTPDLAQYTAVIIGGREGCGIYDPLDNFPLNRRLREHSRVLRHEDALTFDRAIFELHVPAGAPPPEFSTFTPEELADNMTVSRNHDRWLEFFSPLKRKSLFGLGKGDGGTVNVRVMQRLGLESVWRADIILLLLPVLGKTKEYIDELVKNMWLPRIKHHFPEARILLIGEDVGRRRNGQVTEALQREDSVRLANCIGATYLEWECELPNIGVKEIAGAIAWAAIHSPG